eukprot:2671453-Amphidinium_carterae.1
MASMSERAGMPWFSLLTRSRQNRGKRRKVQRQRQMVLMRRQHVAVSASQCIVHNGTLSRPSSLG